MFNLVCLMLIPCCFSKNNTDSLSVAPVRYPVVQISSKLHIMKQNKTDPLKPRSLKCRGEAAEEE